MEEGCGPKTDRQADLEGLREKDTGGDRWRPVVGQGRKDPDPTPAHGVSCPGRGDSSLGPSLRLQGPDRELGVESRLE